MKLLFEYKPTVGDPIKATLNERLAWSSEDDAFTRMLEEVSRDVRTEWSPADGDQQAYVFRRVARHLGDAGELPAGFKPQKLPRGAVT